MHVISYTHAYHTTITEHKRQRENLNSSQREKNIIFKGTIIGAATDFPISTTKAKRTMKKNIFNVLGKKILSNIKVYTSKKNTFQRISDKLIFLLTDLH